VDLGSQERQGKLVSEDNLVPTPREDHLRQPDMGDDDSEFKFYHFLAVSSVSQ
jgi:hypothetical protein